MRNHIFNNDLLQRYGQQVGGSKNALVVILLALAFVSIIWFFTVSRVNFERESEMQSNIRVKFHEVRDFEEHTSLNLQSIDQVVSYIKTRYEENSISPMFMKRTQEATILSNLEKMKSLPKMQSFIANEKGEIIVSRLPLQGTMNFYETNFFQAHRKDAGNKTYIGEMIMDPAKPPLFMVSRRINQPDGNFGGVAAIALNYEAFSILFPQMDFGQQQVFALIGGDGVVQGEQAKDGKDFVQQINMSKLLKSAQEKDVGYYMSTGLDNVSRIICFRVVPDYSLIAIVVVKEEQVLGGFYKRQWEYYKAACWLSLFIIGTFAIILRMLFQQEKIKNQLKDSEEGLQIIFNSVQAGIAIIDVETHKVFDVNQRVLTMVGAKKIEIVGKSCHQFICPAEKGKCPITDLGQQVDNSERILLTIDGKRIPVIKTVSPIRLHGHNYLLESFVDIIERKKAEEELRFLSQHDALTGLCNRAYFEEKLKRIREEDCKPIGIIICDIDGLKLVNDTLGHVTGDCLLIAAGQIIKSVVGDDVAARIGGDEFAIILLQADEELGESICRRIQLEVTKYNQENSSIPLSISLGYSVEGNEGVSMSDLFKEADNNMYREKLHRSRSARSDIVQTVMKMLEVRDFITEGHADRVEELSADLGRSLGLTEKKIGDLRLLAKFHDIGKVGISDQILFKPGTLTSEERKEMNRHSEIGYRIARSATDLLPIADWILKHHERWDGKGYPLGLAGEEIPLECRILAIVDSYDAMTNDRPYRKAMSPDMAIAELKYYAGTQFDPQLVKKFMQIELIEFSAAI